MPALCCTGPQARAVHLHQSGPKTPKTMLRFLIPQSTSLKAINTANYIHVINILIGTFSEIPAEFQFRTQNTKGFQEACILGGQPAVGLLQR